MIRQPGSDEFASVCPLLYQSGPQVFNWFFAGKSSEEVCRYLEILYNSPDNAFSKELIWVDEYNKDIRGAILGLPGKDKHRLDKNIGKQGKNIGKIAGFRKTIIMIFHGSIEKYLSVTEDDEYYIGNLAVKTEHRSKNIGPALLDRISSVADSIGYKKLSLLVKSDNDHARHVYEKYGFKTAINIELPAKYHKHGLISFCKLVKKI